jgi:tRNA(Glu) U13 pseudouridine synthase TruD
MSVKHVVEVTAEDAAAGKYKIEDVVIAQPGNKVKIPPVCAAMYQEVLREMLSLAEDADVDVVKLFTNDETKEFSLGGDYRKMVVKVPDLTYEVVR